MSTSNPIVAIECESYNMNVPGRFSPDVRIVRRHNEHVYVNRKPYSFRRVLFAMWHLTQGGKKTEHVIKMKLEKGTNEHI